MTHPDSISVGTPLGPRRVDSEGAPLSVVRLDSERSYAGIGSLLQAYIDDRDEKAWEAIKAKIDYTYENLTSAMNRLHDLTGFGREVRARVDRGQKVLFKPNLVSVQNIDPQTHGPDGGTTSATEWSFVAALMRWFHDSLGIRYHQMCLGEAGTTTFATAGFYSFLHPDGQRVTTEAAMEGRAGSFYGGWGFYFVRRYLAEGLAPGSTEDPMLGYEESVSGTYLPPGHAGNRLMVYDLNRVSDAKGKGRDVEVPDGVNYRSITLHKAIVGGDPTDSADREAYPGCVLVNVPRLKVHAAALLTNAVKNLGIGLYPMDADRGEAGRWQYAYPHGTLPGVKALLPHQMWVAEMDHETGLPKLDEAGKIIVRRSGGMPATMADALKAVSHQGVYMIHVVDGVETINLDHNYSGLPVPEGLVVAALDPVAADMFCARYMFGNVPMAEAEESGIVDNLGGHFPQRVPVPRLEDGAIVTGSGYDCPLARYGALAYVESRGLGRLAYHVVGQDVQSGLPLVSVGGRLGTVAGGTFTDLCTKAMYYAIQKVPWDLQKTMLAYLEATDRLTGSSWRQKFLATFDENGDGVVDYDETGRKATSAPRLHMAAVANAHKALTPLGYLSGTFTRASLEFKYQQATWNASGLDLLSDFVFHTTCLTALRMSTAETESADLFAPSLVWGRGKWPSFEMASFITLGSGIYGPGFPSKLGLGGLYGLAFRYADAVQNAGRYCGHICNRPEPGSMDRYIADLKSGRADPLGFTLYVPDGFATVGGESVPNVAETADSALVFTAVFRGGETWPGTVEDARRLSAVRA
ncbi:MAG: DUF362 domain-containing protein [Chloroflexota bacterium]